MLKEDLVRGVASESGVNLRDTEKTLDAFEIYVAKELKNRRSVRLSGFGTFLARFRAARSGVNPQKPTERIRIPEMYVPKFKAGRTLKDAIK